MFTLPNALQVTFVSIMKVVRPSLRLLWFLLGASLALGCDWRSWEDRGLDLKSSKPELGSPTEVADAEECKAACCLKPGCDVALVGAPQDGPLQCFLVACWIRESDQCRLINSSQFQVHRRKERSGSVSPLLGEPKQEQQKQENQSKTAPSPTAFNDFIRFSMFPTFTLTSGNLVTLCCNQITPFVTT